MGQMVVTPCFCNYTIVKLGHVLSNTRSSFVCSPFTTKNSACNQPSPRVRVTTHAPSMSTTPESSSQTSVLEPTETQTMFRCPNCKTILPTADVPVSKTFPSQCPNCSAKFPKRNGYVDLTLNSRWYILPSPFTVPRQALFELPQVAYAYERGWRSRFRYAGFPGPEMEADLALDFLLPAKTLLDISCGSGIITRRLAAANAVNRLIATDISHPMLTEASNRVRSDVRLPDLDFVRADVANLPFADESVEAVHASAALHCWPSVQDGLQEIRRILVPGGKFFATTFYTDAYIPERAPRFLRSLARGVYNASSNASSGFFEEDELLYLLRAAGFASVDVERRGSCAIVRVVKADK